jgi:hypothetical protein
MVHEGRIEELLMDGLTASRPARNPNAILLFDQLVVFGVRLHCPNGADGRVALCVGWHGLRVFLRGLLGSLPKLRPFPTPMDKADYERNQIYAEDDDNRYTDW